ncbi:MAG: hypothetical protein ACKOJF_19655, partial [Planctomycetaceae bacterium]
TKDFHPGSGRRSMEASRRPVRGPGVADRIAPPAAWEDGGRAALFVRQVCRLAVFTTVDGSLPGGFRNNSRKDWTG